MKVVCPECKGKEGMAGIGTDDLERGGVSEAVVDEAVGLVEEGETAILPPYEEVEK